MQYYNLWKDDVDQALDQDRSEIVSLAIRREMLQGRLYLTAYLAQDLRQSAQYAAWKCAMTSMPTGNCAAGSMSLTAAEQLGTTGAKPLGQCRALFILRS